MIKIQRIIRGRVDMRWSTDKSYTERVHDGVSSLTLCFAALYIIRIDVESIRNEE